MEKEEGEGIKEGNGDDLKQLKDQVKEFRTNNIALQNQIKAYEDNFAALQGRLEAVEAEKTQVEEKVKGKETLEQRLASLEESHRLKDEEIARERTVNKQNRIKSTLVKALTDHGADPAAASDAANLHLAQWDDKDGDLVYMDNGKVVYSQQNPGNNLSPAEWATQLRETKPYFFPPTSGDGASKRDSGMVNGRKPIDISDSVGLGKLTSQQLETEYILVDNGVPV